jgi:hypothetical protein
MRGHMVTHLNLPLLHVRPFICGATVPLYTCRDLSKHRLPGHQTLYCADYPQQGATGHWTYNAIRTASYYVVYGRIEAQSNMNHS